VKDIEDEIPFAVPEGWAWCRLGEIGVWRAGSTPNRKNIAFYKNGTIPWLLTGDLNDGIITDIPNKITEEAYCQTSLKLNPTNSICIAMYGATIGKLGILSTPTTTNQACCVCSDFKGISNKYLFYFLLQHREKFVLLGFGGAQPNISKEKIIATFIPLPPLSEQHRIVTAIEAIFAQIDILEQNKADLQTAVKQAKSKILDLAIHGKLVPQDPADEPASVMLERLRAEKEAKIAAGEMKRGKNDSYIYRKPTDNCYYQKYADGCEENISDEIPFDVPDGWAWCRLPNLCKIPITDGTHQTPTYSDKENGIPFLSSKDVTSRKIDWSKIKYITKELHEELQKRIQPCRNDILLAKNGTTGVAALVDTDKIFDIYVTLAVLRPAEVVHPNYLHYVINSPFCKKQFNGHLTGIGVPNLHLNDICKTIIPLPPLSEQQRIVTKIEELFAQLDFITTALVD